MPEVQIAHLACIRGSKFARIALTYCFDGRERRKYFVQLYRSVRRVNRYEEATSSCNGRYKVQRLGFSFVAPSSSISLLDSRHASFLVSEALSQKNDRKISQLYNIFIIPYYTLLILHFSHSPSRIISFSGFYRVRILHKRKLISED